MEHVLVAIDFSAHGRAVLEQARKLARPDGAQLTLLHVAAPDPDFVGFEVGPQSVRDTRARELDLERREIHRMAEEVREEGIAARAFLFAGPTAETILREAGRLPADFIVMGSHGRGMLGNAFVGSVSRDVLRGATCPVVVVPARVAAAEES